MLLQFTVENVLSFRDRAVFSLLAAPEVEHQPPHVMEIAGLPAPVLRVAALHGASASGKSCMVKALELFRDLVLEGTPPDQPVDVVPFKLDAGARARPCRFEVELLLAGDRWRYGLACTTARVEAEWLHRDVGEGEQRVFERTRDEGDGVRVVFGDALGPTEPRRASWEQVAAGTHPAQPFLAEARARGVTELEPLLDFWRSILVIGAGQALSELPILLSKYPSLLEFASELLALAGSEVEALELVTETREGDPEPSAPRLRFRHAALGGSVSLEAFEESDGTRRLVELSPLLWGGITGGAAVVIDQLDHGLHSALSRVLVERFLAADGSKGGQLIFTTHAVDLLDHLLPRDSIWVVEKDRSGGSALRSLAEGLSRRA